MATVSIVIEGDEQDAVQSVQRLNSAVRQAEPAYRQVGQVSKQVMGDVARQSRQANDAAQLLGRTLGVQLPRELNRFLATSKTIGPILAQAFNVSLMLGFGAAAVTALVKIPGFISDMVEGMTHWRAQTEAAIKLQGEWNTLFLETTDRARKFREELTLIGLEGSKRDAQIKANVADSIAIAQKQLEVEQAKLHDLERRSQQTLPSASGALSRVLTRDAEEAKAKIDDQVLAVNRAGMAVGALKEQYELAGSKLKDTFGKENQRQIEETTKLIDDQQKAIQKFIIDRAAGGQGPPDAR